MKLVFVLLALAAIARAASIGSAMAAAQPALLKRMLLIYGSDEDFVPFEQLHSNLFQHQPAMRQLSSSEILERYPDVLFYNKQPVFRAWPYIGLSRNGLKKAYDSFGKVHVLKYEEDGFLTIAPGERTLNAVEQPTQHRSADRGLEEFVRRKQFIRRHFGRDAMIATYGADLKPRKVSILDAFRSYKGTYTAQPDTSYTKIRKGLNQRRYAEISSRDGRSTLKLELFADGSVNPSVTGGLREAARALHI